MHIQVETRKDPRGIDVPQNISTDGRSIIVARILDEWHGKDHRYFKLLDGNGDLYIVRFDQNSMGWELTFFESSRRHQFSVDASNIQRPN